MGELWGVSYIIFIENNNCEVWSIYCIVLHVFQALETLRKTQGTVILRVSPAPAKTADIMTKMSNKENESTPAPAIKETKAKEVETTPEPPKPEAPKPDPTPAAKKGKSMCFFNWYTPNKNFADDIFSFSFF